MAAVASLLDVQNWWYQQKVEFIYDYFFLTAEILKAGYL